MRRVIEDDICSTLLVVGEKVRVVTYDHLEARISDLYNKLVKYEINFSHKAMKFLAKIDDKESRYDFYFDSDLHDPTESCGHLVEKERSPSPLQRNFDMENMLAS